MYKIITVFLLSLRIIEYLPYYCFPETIYIYTSAVDNKWFLSSVFSRKLFWTYIHDGKLCKYYIISYWYTDNDLVVVVLSRCSEKLVPFSPESALSQVI